MKKLMLSAFVFMLSTAVIAQSEKFTAAMKKNLVAMDSSFSGSGNLLDVANNFERIANAEKTQWLPYYYAAFCQVNIGYREQDKDKVDAIADKAATLLAKADSLSPNNSEISCVKSMIASCHMMVNPMQRWQQYGMESSQNLDEAMTQDANNPRPYFLKGQGLKYTPEQFGGGCKTAKPLLEQAAAKYASFKPSSDISPTWGKGLTEKLLVECK